MVKELNLSNFNTINVINMCNMFYECKINIKNNNIKYQFNSKIIKNINNYKLKIF